MPPAAFLAQVRRRLDLGRAAIVALITGAVVLVVSIAAFGDTTEDVVRHNGPVHHDVSRLRFFTDHRSHLLVQVSKVLTEIGTVPVLALLALAAGWLLWRRGLPLVVATAPLCAIGIAAAVVAMVKHAVDRARPPVALHLVAESDASFPSGHATHSAAVFLTIALVSSAYVLRRPLARASSVAMAVLLTGAIGASRLVLGVHWPTDVLAGWALGIAVAVGVTMTVSVLLRLNPPSGELPAGRPSEGGCQLRSTSPRHAPVSAPRSSMYDL